MDIHSTTLLAMAIIFLGAFVQTTIGFGLAVIAAPLLFLINPNYVPGPIFIASLIISILNTLKYRENIEIGGLKIAVIARIPGSILGGILLLYASSTHLSLWLGLLVLLALAISLLPFRIEPTQNRMAFAGALSGFMGTSSGIGGPPMALLLQHQEANALRGNLSAFFLFSAIISIIVLICIGHFTLHHLFISIPLLPATWAGYRFALFSMQYISKEWIRYSALLLCFVSGMSAIYQGL
ncbi:sulfite exporter TauE/SafE family protein [Psychromonas sp. PT13]|uniref:sulfite exporter TauE/SafE family protein n=1 Tax=Psychromonas sp. PT13 TaxID=3439547 RepID=UPI003EBCEE00